MELKQLQTFLDNSHSVYHAVAGLSWELEAAGYMCLAEGEDWELIPGGKYYMTRGGSALIAFRIPYETPRGFLMAATHADRPGFQVKENGILTGEYTRLATEKYGGMIISSWLDRPLSVAGRVLVETPEGAQSRLVDIDEDLLLIPNVAIHMNRKVNEGYSWNPAVDTLPLLGSAEAANSLWEKIEKAAGGNILSHDLYLYLRQKASVWGVEKEYLSAQGLDDLACSWCALQGFLEAEETAAIPVLCVFNNEEVGSQSPQGADSSLLKTVLTRICKAMFLEEDKLLSQSFMVSADNAHALHPNHPELSDKTNAPVLGGGVVIKFNANQRYTTDAVSAGVFRRICEKADVPVQSYYNRADIPGGSTLGVLAATQVSIASVDIGLAQLAMHSCYETMGVKDVFYMTRALQTYFGIHLEIPEDGRYRIV